MSEKIPSMESLIAAMDEMKGDTEWLEDALKRRTHDLSERMKELECIYGLLRLGKFDAEKVLEIIRHGWQFPVQATARIHFDAREYKTPNHDRAEVRQTAPILVQNKRRGEVEVGYTKELPFLKEETQLLKAIAVWLGTVL